MRLDGIHHITAICADAQANVDFYVGVIGMKLVKKTVNFDAPDVYHLYYGDESGSPGTILTFFEFPGVDRGSTGPGMVDRIWWAVGDPSELDRWEGRLRDNGVDPSRDGDELEFEDPEGLRLGLRVAGGSPSTGSIGRFYGVTANIDVARSGDLLTEVMGFTQEGSDLRLGNAVLRPQQASGPSIQGAGTVHHIAWACEPEDQAAWRQRIQEAGVGVTEIIDRQYFFSIYFREPSGILFEIATKGPGFTVDEPSDRLGESLKLPPRYEPLRARLEAELKPLQVPALS